MRSFASNGPLLEVVEPPQESDVEELCAKFLAQLSHDMRMPLNSILGVIQMMLETPLSETHKEFADTIAEGAHSLAMMADAVADFSHRLAAHDTNLGAAALAPNDNRSAPLARGSNGQAMGASTPLANSAGVEHMLVNAAAKGRPFAFTTRVPPETAKLVRILVAEDHVTNQRVILRMLSRLGYTADAVNNGLEAVNALTRSPYDIVLMDCQMPELDGYEATRIIRQGGGRFKTTPIIAVTARAMTGDREKCLASGMSDYMSKPVLVQTLASTLEKWILPDEGAGISAAEPPPVAAAARNDSGAATTEPPSAPTGAEDSSSAAAPLGPAIDPNAIELLGSLSADDETFVPKIIELFLDDLAERIEGLKVGAATRDGGAIKRIAHALKGSCGHFGANHLATLCRTLEQIAIEQPVGDPDQALRELIAEADRVRIALQAAKEQAGGANNLKESR